MSWKVRVVAGGVAAVLLALMTVLLFRGPTFRADQVPVSCGSIIAVGWPSDGSYLDNRLSQNFGDSVPDGTKGVSLLGYVGIARDCAERRDTYLGFIAVLLVPICVLGALAVAGGSSRPSAPADAAR